jgi:hypothetical protein
VLEEAWVELNRRWDVLLRGVEDFGLNKEIREFDRNKQDGGQLIARPIAQKAICIASGKAFEEGIMQDRVLSAIKKVSHLSNDPWRGLFWNPENGTMFAHKERIDLAARILCSWMGLQENRADIQERLRNLTSNIAQLPD